MHDPIHAPIPVSPAAWDSFITNAGKDWESFVLTVDGTVVLMPCMTFVLFLHVTDDAGLHDFYRRCREALGDRITHYQADYMKTFRRLSDQGNAKIDAKVDSWFTVPPKKPNAYYYLRMSDGDPDQNAPASQIALHIMRRPAEYWQTIESEERQERREAVEAKRYVRPLLASWLRVTLPLDHPLADPAVFCDWVLDFSLVRSSLPFSGYAGYAINPVYEAYPPRCKHLLSPVLRRFPGFDWTCGPVIPHMLRYDRTIDDFVPLVKRVSWLTLVGDRSLAVLGGREHFRVEIEKQPGVSVRKLEHALAIQAGMHPQFVDIEAAPPPAQYTSVARSLRRIRMDPGNVNPWHTQEGKAWLDAFD